ncbi:Abi family protein [Pseudomonas capsici]|uniref:Abi family protein n=1 Tax=Pseudomonas capsici TaxID=2810614 RepID=UPI0021F1F843|nr:Abi family protein [Pseudomonas capsici]MCV4340326.1 Abi family protein [Pseudomonas capsici]
MAECQQPFQYSKAHSDALEALLSSKRFATYLKAAGFKVNYAFELYLYNARLAKAFLFPLHVVEIALRNAIDEVLSARYSLDWHHDATLHAILTPESLASLTKAEGRASKGGAAAKKDDVISCLTFDFWSNLFRHEYDRPLWQTSMSQLLPNSVGMTRAQLQSLVVGINRFRNRIAHHEPIFALNVSSQYREILNVVEYRSSAASDWLKSHATVNKVMRTRPTSGIGQGPVLSTICDGDFICVEKGLALAQMAGKNPKFIVCMDNNAPVGILDFSDVGRYLLKNVDETGLLDLNEHTLENVLRDANGFNAFLGVDQMQGVNALGALFKGHTRFALVMDQSRAIHGVVAKAHRRY